MAAQGNVYRSRYHCNHHCNYLLLGGHDEPEELGWNSAAEIFEEREEQGESETKDLSRFQILCRFVINNPWVWTLCVINIFIYIVRIGIDNWAPVYCIQALGWSTKDAIMTISFLKLEHC